MGESAAEQIVFDLADKGPAAAERSEPDDGVRGRAARGLHRRPHGVIDRFRTRLFDQRHRAFGHFLLEQKIFLGAGDHVDNCVADAENVITS